MKYILSRTSIVGAVLAFALFTVALASFAFADSRARSESRRAPSLSKVLTILEEHVPEQAQSPEAVTNALANEPQNENENSGSNGGSSAGNGGNGGNSSPWGLVKAGGVVSNSTAIN